MAPSRCRPGHCPASGTETGIGPRIAPWSKGSGRSEEHTSELQSLAYLVCRLLLEKKKKKTTQSNRTLNKTPPTPTARSSHTTQPQRGCATVSEPTTDQPCDHHKSHGSTYTSDSS